MYRGNAPASDGESLQTDVMRFMAIIAFCLIAILALVRSATPTPETAPVKAQSGEMLPGETQSRPKPETSPPPPRRAVPPERTAAERILPAAEPATEPAEAAASALEDAAGPLPAMEPIEPLPDDAVQQETESKASLSLRFASDRDFMRLVARGDIRVYAFRGEDVLSLEPTFEFLESKAPGRVYELLPETIPALMSNALVHQRQNSAGYAWGIRMPPRLERQIQAYVDQGATGQLVINRFAEVEHVSDA